MLCTVRMIMLQVHHALYNYYVIVIFSTVIH